MDIVVTNKLMELLMIGVIFSGFEMAMVQKFKKFRFIKKTWHILLLNLFISFAIGIPFSMWFYDLKILDAIWVGLFSFIGAPTIYEILKNQNMINYKPESLEETEVLLPTENEIRRD